MSAIEYAKAYDEYWSRPSHWDSQSFVDVDALADQILSVLGGGSVLDVGCGMGTLVRSLIRRGVDARGLDIAPRVIEHINALVPNRFQLGTILELPFEDASLDCIVCTDVLQRLDESDVPRALRELSRVARRAVFLTIATAPDRDNPADPTNHLKNPFTFACCGPGA